MLNVISSNELKYCSTQELKDELLGLAKGRDAESLNAKVLFYKNELLPYFEELSQRNPLPIVEQQIPVILGVWTPIWSTIPFHDSLPGRIIEQSYQIFHDDGYYANIARYAPGHQSSFLKKVSAKLPVYDFMVMQKYEVRDNKWYIENVGIFQGFRNREVPLTIDDADSWFTSIVDSKVKPASKTRLPKELVLENLDPNTVKKFEKTYLATPVLEHLYVDSDLRLVKTQREAAQRPSYTIAIRRR
jgi:ribosomal protein S16